MATGSSLGSRPALEERAREIAYRFALGGDTPVHDKTTGEEVWRVQSTERGEVARAAGFVEVPPPEPELRAAGLRRAAALLDEHGTGLASLLCREVGKSIADCRAEVAMATRYVWYAAGWPERIDGRAFAADQGWGEVRPEPAGLVAGVLPWNFPLVQACMKAAPALAAGCPVFLKPSPVAPLAATAAAAIFRESFQRSVVRAFNGGPETGEEVCDVGDVVSFTGSPGVGRQVAERAARHGVLAHLELGGKSAAVLGASADVHAAAWSIASSVTTAAGQVCTAATRALVPAARLDEFVDALVEALGTVKLGDPAEGGMGPLALMANAARAHAMIGLAINAGSSAHHPHGAADRPGWVNPAVVVYPPEAMWTTELFAPVVAVRPYRSTLDADLDDHDLAASVWARDVAEARDLALRVRAGTVWVNQHDAYCPTVPFGGVRASGQGRDNGPEGLAKFLRHRTIWYR